MLLSNLSKIIKISEIYNYKKDIYFESITSNSFFANKNTIFIFNKNSKANVKYIKEAVKNKSPAIITNKYYKFITIPQFIVSDIKKETESLLKNIYSRYPSKSIAITGTNGKTSVTWYISKILNQLKYKNSSVGTLGYFKNGKKINETNLTTPAYEELYKYGSTKKNEKKIFIFEASSHALDQNRLGSYPINIAAITNISEDHLDYHKNFSHYKKSKIKLFTKYLSNNGTAIINKRIKNITFLEKKLKKKKIKIIYFGKKNLYFKKLDNELNLVVNSKKFVIKNLKLNSKIELENLECAIACCIALNIQIKRILKILSKIKNPPGRLQKVYYKKCESDIIIDYAHTPDALKNILRIFSNSDKKPSIVFGCGGDRDESKREKMGKIANQFANKIYITNDNPRNENPSKIRKQIIKYCKSAIEIPNREKAIHRAIKELNFNETLIIAGKGHEKVQIIKNKKIKFDDFKLVKKIIKQ